MLANTRLIAALFGIVLVSALVLLMSGTVRAEEFPGLDHNASCALNVYRAEREEGFYSDWKDAIKCIDEGNGFSRNDNWHCNGSPGDPAHEKCTDEAIAKQRPISREFIQMYINKFDSRVVLEEAKRAAAAARANAAEDGITMLPKCCRIGMTEHQVAASRRGAPDWVHSNTTARGAEDMWSYANVRYLLFENGRLTRMSD